MKFLAIISMLVGSVSASACPNLSGHFTCKDFESGTVQDVTITQTETAQGTLYKQVIVQDGEPDVSEYLANNQEVKIDNPDFTTMTEKSYCDGKGLKTEIHGIAKDGTVLDAIMYTEINAENNMYDSYVGTYGKDPIKFEEVCQRIP